jgi:adenylylsulfate kinase
MAQNNATNITWHKGSIEKKDRENLLRQKGVVIWFTGLSGSGKSTLAHRIEELLFERGHLCFILDGDNVRHGLNNNLGFSPEDREENIRRIGEVSKLFTDAGLITLTAFISPYKADRDKARSLLDKDEFIEVYVKVPLEIAEERDPKGLYKKARAGKIKEFTGISAPYEEPESPELVIDTSLHDLEESSRIVIDYLEKRGFLRKNWSFQHFNK